MKKIQQWIKAEMDTWDGADWLLMSVIFVAAPFVAAVMLLG